MDLLSFSTTFLQTDFAAGEGIDVRPHPHIGLSTLSYLLEGQVLHHDSLGNKQILSPGDVNWMTAGKGISHSERMPEDNRGKAHRLNLLQFWVALPVEHEDRDPSFTHHGKETIPQFQVSGGAHVSLIAGKAFGKTSPVEIFSPLFFMDVKLKKVRRSNMIPGHMSWRFLLFKVDCPWGIKRSFQMTLLF